MQKALPFLFFWGSRHSALLCIWISLRDAQESILKEHGLESLDELRKLKSKLRDLVDENAVLLRERDTAHSTKEDMRRERDTAYSTKEDMSNFTRRLSVQMEENKHSVADRLKIAMEENKRMLSGTMAENRAETQRTLSGSLAETHGSLKERLDSVVKQNEKALSANERVLSGTVQEYKEAMKETEKMLSGTLAQLQIPKVSGSNSMIGPTSADGALIEADLLLEQKQQRHAMLQANKKVIDLEVTKVQSVLRGHIARQRLCKQLDRMPTVNVSVHPAVLHSKDDTYSTRDPIRKNKEPRKATSPFTSDDKRSVPHRARDGGTSYRRQPSDKHEMSYFRPPAHTESSHAPATQSSVSGGARYSDDESVAYSDSSIMSDSDDDLW